MRAQCYCRESAIFMNGGEIEDENSRKRGAGTSRVVKKTHPSLQKSITVGDLGNLEFPLWPLSLRPRQHIEFLSRTIHGWQMIWACMLAYITGSVDQELLLRNEYLTDAMRAAGSMIVQRRRLHR